MSLKIFAVADDGHDVVRRNERRSEQAQLPHRAGDAADADEVADLERTQDQHEGACREIAEQAAPRRADGQTGACQQRSERSRLNAEIAQNAEDQCNRQDCGDDRAEVLRQRRIDATAVHRPVQDADHAFDQPPADEPESDGGNDLDRQCGQGRGDEEMDRVDVHR